MWEGLSFLSLSLRALYCDCFASHEEMLLRTSSLWNYRSISYIRSSLRYSSSSSSSSLYASSSSSSSCETIDLSQYLLSGADYRKAPKIPDFIGPLRIGLTRDGRGRGLFLTEDVSVGQILIASNAFSAAYNDDGNLEVYDKVVSIVKSSPRALRQLYSLAGSVEKHHHSHHVPNVPKVELFDQKVSDSEFFSLDEEENEDMAFDEARIKHIIITNSFSGKIPAPRSEPELESKINALWLLPSFVNHSCSPNVGRLLVGEVMIFIAAKDMKANEEISICYTDCMSPLRKRDKVLIRTGGGFDCNCERCVLEKMLEPELQQLSDSYLEHYDKAAEEVYSVATTRAKGPFPASKKLASIFIEVKRKLDTLTHLTEREKQWILGGYSNAFLANFLTSGYTRDFKEPEEFATSTAMEVVLAMYETVPGFLRTVTFAVMLATMSPDPEYRSVLVQLARDECIRMYGKQRPDVIRHMAVQAVELVPFF